MSRGSFKMLSCAVSGIQAVEARTRHSFPRHSHEQYGIGIILDGAQKSLSGRGMVEAEAGDLITVNPGEVHDGLPLTEEGRAWHMLYFDPAVLRNFAEDMAEARGETYELTLPVMRSEETAQAFRKLYSWMTAPPDHVPDMDGEELMFDLLARMAHRRQIREEAGAPSVIARARRAIDALPEVAPTLGDLAAETGLSRFQVLRGFARETGFTPHAYLIQRRTDLARRLISEGMALAQAAAASGFADQSHMTRTFSRIYGISPGIYAFAVR